MEDIYDLFDVSNMVDREGEREEAEVAWTVDKFHLAGLAHTFFVAHALRLNKEENIPDGGREAHRAMDGSQGQIALACSGSQRTY